VDHEKLRRGWLGEASGSICISDKLARDIKNKSLSRNESSDVVYNADMFIGEIRQFCRLQDEGQGLIRVATLCYA
jgi:hypothetical protein